MDHIEKVKVGCKSLHLARPYGDGVELTQILEICLKKKHPSMKKKERRLSVRVLTVPLHGSNKSQETPVSHCQDDTVGKGAD